MHTHTIENFQHSHVFLGEAHERNERKTWTVIMLCAAMMVAEIVGGYWFGSSRSSLTAYTCLLMPERFS